MTSQALPRGVYCLAAGKSKAARQIPENRPGGRIGVSFKAPEHKLVSEVVAGPFVCLGVSCPGPRRQQLRPIEVEVKIIERL